MDTEVDEETVLQMMLEEHDEDAQFVQDFEEQVILTCQDSPELAGSPWAARMRPCLFADAAWPRGSPTQRAGSVANQVTGVVNVLSMPLRRTQAFRWTSGRPSVKRMMMW